MELIIKNNGIKSSLFSNDFINNHLVDLNEFKNLDLDYINQRFDEINNIYKNEKQTLKLKNEAQLEADFLRPIFRKLDHIFHVQTEKESEETSEGTKSIDYAFFESDDKKIFFINNNKEKNRVRYNSCSTICETKLWDRLKDHYRIKKNDNSDPIYQLKICYLDGINPKEQKATIPYGILTDGKSWRLYSYRNDHEQFFEIDLERILEENDFEGFTIFWFFFSKEAFSGEKYLEIVSSGASKLQKEVSDELRKQVYTSLELIATGIFRTYREKNNFDIFLKYPEIKTFLQENDLDSIDISNPRTERTIIDIIYSETLVYLFRVLFLLFADHRGLLKEKKIETNFYNFLNKISEYKPQSIGLLTEEHVELDRNYDRDIQDIFKIINNKYNGGLFSERLHPILEEFDINDILYANAIDNLTRIYDKKLKRPVRVDFSTLDVRHLGTIYEGLLEFKLTKSNKDTEIPLLFEKNKTRKILKNDLFLTNDKGERKATGSYYTPDYIVQYIVENTLEPLVKKILDNTSGFKEKIKSVLNLKICDPAMGSGHFLVEVIDFLEICIHDIILEEQEKINDLRKSKKKENLLSELAPYLKKIVSGMYKRYIARSCIFGVDKNSMAVELAKLSIWLFTLQENKKLEFFDYNLRCGDSLIGSQRKTFSNHDASGDGNGSGQILELFVTDEELYNRIVEHYNKIFQEYFHIDDIDKKREFFYNKIVPAQQRLKYLANLELYKEFANKNDEIFNLLKEKYQDLIQKIRKRSV